MGGWKWWLIGDSLIFVTSLQGRGPMMMTHGGIPLLHYWHVKPSVSDDSLWVTKVCWTLKIQTETLKFCWRSRNMYKLKKPPSPYREGPYSQVCRVAYKLHFIILDNGHNFGWGFQWKWLKSLAEHNYVENFVHFTCSASDFYYTFTTNLWKTSNSHSNLDRTYVVFNITLFAGKPLVRISFGPLQNYF